MKQAYQSCQFYSAVNHGETCTLGQNNTTKSFDVQNALFLLAEGNSLTMEKAEALESNKSSCNEPEVAGMPENMQPSEEEIMTSVYDGDCKTKQRDDQQPFVSDNSCASVMAASESLMSQDDETTTAEAPATKSVETSEEKPYQSSGSYSLSKDESVDQRVLASNQDLPEEADDRSLNGHVHVEIASEVNQVSGVQDKPVADVTPAGDSAPGSLSGADGTDSLQHEGKTEREGVACNRHSTTEYLDSVIADIQSVNAGSQSEAAGDSVQISRAELALMVEHTLKAQTMCNYMQNLVHKNHLLNKQNEVMKDTIVQMRNWQHVGDKGEKGCASLPPQPTEGKVFRFDKCSLPLASLPTILDKSASTSGFCSVSKSGHGSSNLSTDQEHHTSLVQTDGESMSGVPQLSVCVSYDGDPARHSKESRGASAAGSSSNTGAAASTFAAGPGLQYNIPNSAVFDAAQYYSMGPQLMHEEPMVGCAGVPSDQHERAMDELEKMKLFLHKITTEGGVHPNNLMELVDLRKHVDKLRTENGRLKAELENCLNPLTAQNSCMQLQEKIRAQKKMEDTLLNTIKMLQDENKKLKGMRPTSQPPSSVGLQALPNIPASQTHVVKRDSEMQTDSGEMDKLLYKLQQENGKLRKEVAKVNLSVTDARKAQENAWTKLSACNHEISTLSHQLQVKATHCKELGNQLMGLNSEIDRLKKLHSQEAERCKQLEQMIADERKRWSRDEKQLLDQVKKDAKIIQGLEELVLAVDRSREGIPLQPSQQDHLATLKAQSASRGSLTAPGQSTRSASPRAGAVATSSTSSRALHHNQPRSSSGSTTASASSRPLHGFHGNNPNSGGDGGSRERHGKHSTMQQSGVGPHASLPSVSPRQRTRQSSGNPEQSHGNRPLQRSNIAGSSPEMLPPGSSGGSGRQRQH